MKKGLVGLFLCGVFIFSIFPFASAEEKQKQKSSPLDGSEWQVTLTPSSESNKKEKESTDTLTFEKGKITSKQMGAKGFPSSNYTLTEKEGEGTVWETMQTSDSGEVSFWHANVKGSSMRGILSHHPSKGDPRDYSFSGQKTKTLEAAPASEAASSSVAASPVVPKEAPISTKEKLPKAQPVVKKEKAKK